jgi:hypothetical protein
VSRYQVRPKTPKTWTIDGWTGVYDSRSEKAERDGDAPLLINLMPSDPVRGGPVYLRQGRAPLGNAATAPRLGSGSHLVQWMGEVTTTVGGSTCVAIADGEIWSVAQSLGTVTKLVSTANLTTAGITLASNIAVKCVAFNGALVVAGINSANAPFTWDGSSGSGGLVKLTNAPTSTQDATVYYAKLFFLKSDHLTLSWSEENQPNTGYEAGGYNNAWELTQTSNDLISGIIGTNEGLYYGRQTSVGVIRGAVSSTFSTDGVHDSVHIGGGPDSFPFFAYVGGTLFWMTLSGTIYAYRGGEVTEVTAQLPRIYGYESLTQHASNYISLPVYGAGEEGLGAAVPQYLLADPYTQRLYAEFGSTSGGRWVHVYDAQTLKLLSLWSYGTTNDRIVTTWPQKFQFAATRQVSGGATTYLYVDDAGYVFQQLLAVQSTSVATNKSVTADYTEAGVGTGVVGTLIGPMHGWSTNVEWQFDRIDVLTDVMSSSGYGVTLHYLTSRLHKSTLNSGQSQSGGGSNTPFEKHLAFGLNANGRWIRPVITLTGSTSTTAGNQPPQLFGYSITAYPVSAAPALT